MQDNLNKVDFDIMEKLFEAKGFVPNESQREAILCVDRPLFLTAGPGSGKTRVLLWRTVNLIVFHDVKPNEIFLATFTEKAALQLKQGLQGLLSIASTFTGKPYDLAEMYVGTLHSLCLKLLSDRRFNKEKARVRRPVVLDDLQQYQFIYNFHMKEIIDASGINYGDDITKAYFEINQWFDIKSRSKNQTTANLISFFNRMNEEDFSDEKLKLSDADETLNALFKMTIKYRELLNTNGVERADFSSLQKKAYNYISSSSGAGAVFKHVIVDEYQDTNTIQQKIYMKLAEGTKHICVVGDDDQALYRFRGATVENLVGFETICKDMIGETPKRIDLNINYRSRAQIVNTYKDFIETCDWSDPDDDKVFYRIQNKNIEAHSDDEGPAVILQKGKKEEVAEKVVDLVIDLKEKGKITDFNQCAILFPSLRYNNEMNPSVDSLAKAFSNKGIPYYAPRAKNFLNTKECLVTFGLFARIFSYKTKIKEQKYAKWFEDAVAEANDLIEKDANLARFVVSRQKQIAFVKNNYAVLIKFCNKQNIDVNSSADLSLINKLSLIQDLDEEVKKALGRGQLKKFIDYRNKINNPVNVSYVLARVTALDWTILDLFYQLNCFDYYSSMYERAENGGEDAGMYNLGMITGLISRFMEIFSPILSGSCFQKNDVAISMFDSFLYMIYRRGETEYEDSEDPFPKGCVPFITIHQSKGLEFPVVILGSMSHRKHQARALDVLVRDIQNENGETPEICEPLDKMDTYDTMRMFYVAISRAKNLVVLCWPDRANVFDCFKNYLTNIDFPNIDGFETDSLPEAKVDNEQLAHVYSYTADFIPYGQCPRNYMVFHKYGFVPSRSQTMFFGSLVHQTIEDLQNYLRVGESYNG